MAEELDLPTTGLDRDDLRTRIDDVVEKLKQIQAMIKETINGEAETNV